MDRPDFIKHCEELRTDESFSYPGDSETFGTGAALGRILGLKRIAVNYEVLKPGDRSSWPHAHSADEEFIFILEGTPQVWINGELHDLVAGDSVGLAPGTGHAHTLINNSENEVRALVIGDTEAADDKIFYPMHPDRNREMQEKGFFWSDYPESLLGPHDGWPDKKRPTA
ncbi:MAG: cupin domain-containing protein [Halobacteriovoraceae bacterium]|jgi:uncharacterized cupin superfamily protein|nr:cupin domain-containing protein [Halobacteriovoraceae bacterium]MBT5092695.1 cupin domain-containing protein [Halobacteriovoraceae bacterium]